jgi:hypothetical protein
MMKTLTLRIAAPVTVAKPKRDEVVAAIGGIKADIVDKK